MPYVFFRKLYMCHCNLSRIKEFPYSAVQQALGDHSCEIYMVEGSELYRGVHWSGKFVRGVDAPDDVEPPVF
jgi:hypothetical protein